MEPNPKIRKSRPSVPAGDQEPGEGKIDLAHSFARDGSVPPAATSFDSNLALPASTSRDTPVPMGEDENADVNPAMSVNGDPSAGYAVSHSGPVPLT